MQLIHFLIHSLYGVLDGFRLASVDQQNPQEPDQRVA